MKPLGTKRSHDRGKCTAAMKEDAEFQGLSWKMHTEKHQHKGLKGDSEKATLYLLFLVFLWKKIALFERNRKLRLSILPSIEKHRHSLGGLKSNSQAFIRQAKSVTLSIASREK